MMATDRGEEAAKGRERRLADAVRSIKIAAADRSDVVVDMKEADRARLEILAQELQPVFDDVPSDDDRFDFAISSGLQPRLWIDVTTHVMMGRDRRTYRLVRDTRLGRVVLAESTNVEPVAKAVTLYIAEKLYERERAMTGDLLPLRQTASATGERSEDDDGGAAEDEAVEAKPVREPRVMAHQDSEDERTPIKRERETRRIGRSSVDETSAVRRERAAQRLRSLLSTENSDEFVPERARRRYPVYESQSVADPRLETSLGLLLAILAGLFVVGAGFIWLFSSFAS